MDVTSGRCHLSNLMPDSFLHESIGQRITKAIVSNPIPPSLEGGVNTFQQFCGREYLNFFLEEGLMGKEESIFGVGGDSGFLETAIINFTSRLLLRAD